MNRVAVLVLVAGLSAARSPGSSRGCMARSTASNRAADQTAWGSANSTIP